MSPDEFEANLIKLCDAYGVREFAIYGRFAQVIDVNGQLHPPDRLIWLSTDDAMVAAEAEYHFGLIAEGKEP